MEGVRVLELSQFLPGPHLTMMMADQGADVIKIEPPTGEPNRAIGVQQGGTSVFFRNTHRGKRSVALNLKQPEAVDAFLRLAETADVVVESFRPGVVGRLGVDYDAIAARNSRIVYCSISAFGQTGPYASRPAHDLGVEALGGTLSVNLGSDGKPTSPGVPVADVTGSMMGLSAILMALYRREKTGAGDYIDISMHDSLLSWTANALGPVFGESRAPDPKRERTWGGAAFYRLYETADGQHLALAGRELKFVRALLEALGRPDLEPLCAGEPGAVEDPVREFLDETFRGKTLAEWEAWFGGMDIAWAPVKNLREAFDDPHARARQMRLLDDDRLEHVGSPLKFRNEPGAVRFHAPDFGEHNKEVFSELGLDEQEIADLTPGTK